MHERRAHSRRRRFGALAGVFVCVTAAVTLSLPVVSSAQNSETPTPTTTTTTTPADTTAPTIVSLEAASQALSGASYSTNVFLAVEVEFSEPVVVVAENGSTERATLEIDIGGVARKAYHIALLGLRNGGRNHIFAYLVQADDSDTDGFSVGTNKLTLVDGTIRDAAGNDADLSHSALSTGRAHRVNAPPAPTVSSVAVTSDPGDDLTYGLNDTITWTVTFNEEVTVTGSPTLEFMIGDSSRTAAANAAPTNTASSTSEFSYTVVGGDFDNDGVSTDANPIDLNGATIRGSNDEDAILDYGLIADVSGHKVSASGGL